MLKILLGMVVLSLISCCPGPQGVTGTPGQNGSNCTVTNVPIQSTVAPNGGALVSCSDGTSSLLLNGTNGTNGSNGTVVTSEQFCTGVTPVYPSSFPEVGFCIGNILYAVYSANDGFLSVIPPGTYSSNGINASCTFTVGPNCTISH